MKQLVEIDYRLVQQQELVTVLELESLSFGSDQPLRQCLNELFFRPSSRCMGAYIGSQLVGYALSKFCRSGKSATIVALAVHPAYRHIGVGYHLILQTEEMVRQSEGHVLFADFSPIEAGARFLFHELGFGEFRRGQEIQVFLSPDDRDRSEEIVTLRKILSRKPQFVAPKHQRHTVKLPIHLIEGTIPRFTRWSQICGPTVN